MTTAWTNSAFAGPVATVGRFVESGQRVAVDQIHHGLWDELLNRYVDARGMVDYGDWKNSTQDLRKLDRYLAHLSSASIHTTASREAKLAFWINAYNAVTIKGILQEYPTTSIRNHTARVGGYNIWKDLQLIVEGRRFSLSEMEHKVLRPMGEPRIHFAIVCASMGCPRLLHGAYTKDKLEEQLSLNTEDFFADPEKFRYSAVRRTVWVSPILQWFSKDFGRTQNEVLQRLAPYLPDEAAQNLAHSKSVRIHYLNYDWALNDQSSAK